MKKLAYLTMMFVALTLMSFSCEKEENDDPIVPETTLEEEYFEWSNLESVTTDGSTTAYPKLSIVITDDVVDVEVILYNEVLGECQSPYKFDKITIVGSSITFSTNDIGQVCKELKGTFVMSGNQITFTVPESTNGFDGNGHVYVLE